MITRNEVGSSSRPFIGLPAAAAAWSAAQVGARRFSASGNANRRLADAVATCDCMVVPLASTAAFYLRFGPVPIPIVIWLATLFTMISTFNIVRGIDADHRVADLVSFGAWVRLAKAWTVVFVTLVSIAYLTKTSDTLSRAWVVTWYSIGLLGFAAVRVLAAQVRSRWRRQGRLARIVAIVDLAGNSDLPAWKMVQSAAGDIRLAGVFRPAASPERRNGLGDLIALSRVFRIDEIVVTGAHRDRGDLAATLSALASVPTTVRLHLDMPELEPGSVSVEMFGDSLMLTVQNRPLSGLNGWVKRLEDLVLGSLVLLWTAPVLAMIAIAIRMDSPGPVLFRQRRLGFNNNVFVVYKFRTMYWQGISDTVVPQAQRNDPRVTRVGKFLRRTSLDELPQIINVLRGDMSLVGPRPHALAHNEKYAGLIDGYLGRHRVQPGITGWAQVSGYRGETDTLDKMEGRVKYDLAYIANWSVFFDLKIIMKTALMGAFDRRAY